MKEHDKSLANLSRLIRLFANDKSINCWQTTKHHNMWHFTENTNVIYRFEISTWECFFSSSVARTKKENIIFQCSYSAIPASEYNIFFSYSLLSYEIATMYNSKHIFGPSCCFPAFFLYSCYVLILFFNFGFSMFLQIRYEHFFWKTEKSWSETIGTQRFGISISIHLCFISVQSVFHIFALHWYCISFLWIFCHVLPR